jgi:hypothetical protein
MNPSRDCAAINVTRMLFFSGGQAGRGGRAAQARSANGAGPPRYFAIFRNALTHLAGKKAANILHCAGVDFPQHCRRRLKNRGASHA